MKTTFIFLLSVLSLSSAFAATKSTESTNLAFKCISAIPTTSFILEKSDKPDIMVLKVIHHNGTQFMPIHEGIVVPNDLPYLKENADLMTKLGDYVTFEFPTKYCKKYDDKIYSCSRGNTQTINGVEVEAFNLTTSIMNRKVYDYNFTYNRVILMLNFPGYAPIKEITMDYFDKDCEF